MNICLSNVGSRCTGIFKLQKGRSLFPPQTRSEMTESRTLSTTICDPFWVCFEVVQDTHHGDTLFVFHRLKSLTLLPELLPLFHYGIGLLVSSGMERVFSLGDLDDSVGVC